MRQIMIAAAALMASTGVAGAGPASAQTSAPAAAPTVAPAGSPVSGVKMTRPTGGPVDYAAALTDPHRPAKDRDRDAARKPGEMMAFMNLKKGDKVADLDAAGGYFTRLFSTAVGPTGKVYAVQFAEFVKVNPEAAKLGPTLAADYPNVVFLMPTVAQTRAPEPLDVVWISQFYHDLHDPFMGSPDIAAFNKAVFASLKPGGTYIVLDHAAPAGSGVSATNTTHRIDPAAVKAEVTAAGFIFEAESTALRNPADAHDKKVFDPSIRGHTDQFVYKFRKPER